MFSRPQYLVPAAADNPGCVFISCSKLCYPVYCILLAVTAAQLGYRYMNIEKEINDKDVNVDLYGPLVGVSVSF